MHIRKFDHDYSRRFIMEQASKGIEAAGVLVPLWPTAAEPADMSKAYPDEVMSIDSWSKGTIKTGDMLRLNASKSLEFTLIWKLMTFRCSHHIRIPVPGCHHGLVY